MLELCRTLKPPVRILDLLSDKDI